MLKSFKKLISKDNPELNEVQQNIFDTVTELQQTSVCKYVMYDDKLAIASAVDTVLGEPFYLEEGNYVIQYGGILVISYSSQPSPRQGYLFLNRLSNPSELLTPKRYIGLPDMSGVLRRGPFIETIEFNSKGESLQLFANILTTGGTVDSRDVFNPYICAWRKSL